MNKFPQILSITHNQLIQQLPDGRIVLYSYNRPVALWTRDKGNCLLKGWNDKLTTMKHVATFFHMKNVQVLLNVVKHNDIEELEEI